MCGVRLHTLIPAPGADTMTIFVAKGITEMAEVEAIKFNPAQSDLKGMCAEISKSLREYAHDIAHVKFRLLLLDDLLSGERTISDVKDALAKIEAQCGDSCIARRSA